MVSHSPILRLLLAILLAVSPSACFCPPASAGTGSSCCTSAPEASTSGCCGSGGGASKERASGCDLGNENDETPGGGCDRCDGSCACKTSRTMKAGSPTTVQLDAPAASAMVFGVQPTRAILTALIPAARVDSYAVPKPVTSLLRQYCALTI